MAIQRLWGTILAHQRHFGRFTSSINVESAMFYEVHEEECQDLSKVNCEFPDFWKGFSQISKFKKKKRRRRSRNQRSP